MGQTADWPDSCVCVKREGFFLVFFLMEIAGESAMEV